MKRSIIYSVILALSTLLDNSSFCGNADTSSSSAKNLNYTFNIGCSHDLRSLMQSWLMEYTRENPNITINLSTSETVNEIQILTGKELNSKNEQQPWQVVIGKRVFVPVINPSNPVFRSLSKQGITAEVLRNLLASGQIQSTAPKNYSSHFYLPDDPEILETLSVYVKIESGVFRATLLSSEEELIKTIQNDVNAIGFCSLEAATNQGANGFKNNIALIPIDKNNNGRLDYFEKIYSDFDEFIRGVWIGKYPNQLTESIYAASSKKPEGAMLNFLTWIVSDAQSELKNEGLVKLTGAEVKKGLQLISGDTGKEMLLAENEESSLPIIIIALVVIGLIGAVIAKYIIWNKKNSKEADIQLSFGLNEEVIEAPKGIFFDKSHTWAYMEQDGSVKVGVDDFLQHLTGPLTRIKMKENGDVVRKGEKLMTIMRNGKQLDLYSPVSGVITEKNTSLESNARLLNISPYSEGWVYKIEPKNWIREIEFLTMGAKYKEWLNSEFSRLRDFFAETVKSNDSAYNHIILQDGGELADNILADLDPYVWEDFQRHFIDISK